ncbi:hypothetical protein N7444_002162 [Penicillium canescens]|nr:hypothetical protein N7444_002162 [Penicillium canescens]
MAWRLLLPLEVAPLQILSLIRMLLNSEQLLARDTAEFDAEDLSFITRMAAIGDSYSAGIGAGGSIGLPIYPYPYLIYTDERLGDQSARTFQFVLCSGAVTEDVIKKEIPSIDNNQQVILISAGTFKPKLCNILNRSEVLGGNDDTLDRGCDRQLAYSKSLIAGDAFSKSLDSVITAAKKTSIRVWMLTKGSGIIYYTGYMPFRFFILAVFIVIIKLCQILCRGPITRI